MSLAKAYSAQLVGLQSEKVTIEVDISNGLHSFSIIGLGDRSVDEAKDRVAAAIKNSGFVSPKQKNQKVVVSLAPADLKKEGPSFDVAIAVAYLAACEEIQIDPEGVLFLGELSLEGHIRKISGVLPILCQAASQGFSRIFVPKGNEEEASLAKGLEVYAVTSLSEIVLFLEQKQSLSQVKEKNFWDFPRKNNLIDFSDVRGNSSAKRGLEIAAAGAHNVLMYGPPGTGKTMLAKSFSSILPPLSYEQSIEVTGIHSIGRHLENGLIFFPPFRSPHHTASYPSVVGGGTSPKPGEITLAHRGVLFMDEFPEFDRSVIEALRQPLEDRTVTISRARGVVTFPAQCILIASMNPCPCGKGRDNGCTCTTKSIETYKKKLSGPIMDRLDIWLQLNKVDYVELASKKSSEMSADILQRVMQARNIQAHRFLKYGFPLSFNSEMNAQTIEKCIKIDEDAKAVLVKTAKQFDLSGRAFHRVIKVAQTISDLDMTNSDNSNIKKAHIMEALQFRHKID